MSWISACQTGISKHTCTHTHTHTVTHTHIPHTVTPMTITRHTNRHLHARCTDVPKCCRHLYVLSAAELWENIEAVA